MEQLNPYDDLSGKPPISFAQFAMQSFGKVVCFLSLFVLVFTLPAFVQAMWIAMRGNPDRHLQSALAYLSAFTLIGALGLAAGMLFLFRRPFLGTACLLLAFVASVYGLPDR